VELFLENATLSKVADEDEFTALINKSEGTCTMLLVSGGADPNTAYVVVQSEPYGLLFDTGTVANV